MLSDKIWITRKSRIYAEKRLILANTVSNVLVVWYSTFLVIMTIWNLQYPDDRLNLFLVIGSIAVLVASVVLTSEKYSERYLSLRNCYLKLDVLYSKVRKSEEEKDEILTSSFEEEYSEIISNVENHSDYDYQCLRFDLRNNKDSTLPKFSNLDFFLFICKWSLRNLLIALWFILPIGLSVLTLF